MGLYDRDYYRNRQETRRRKSSGLSAVALIILLNVVLFFINQGTGNALFETMALSGRTTSNPLQWYRCLTYAFAHDPSNFNHIFFNMLALFFFGPAVELRYGKREFVFYYLASAIFGGIVWNVLHFGVVQYSALGASGAISAVIILFAFNFPRAQVLLFFIIPMPMWVAGVLFVLLDTFGLLGGGNIAHDIHLSGAVFAAVYYFSNMRISSILSRKKRKSFSRSSSAAENPAHSYTNSNSNQAGSAFPDLEKRVDEILRKIALSGEESLSEKERETLRFASREYQKRKNQR